MGTDSSSVPDTIKLFDDGTLGDIIPNDNIFSRRIANSSSVLSNVVINPIPSRDNLYASIVAVYGNTVKSIPKRSFTIGNIRPEIVSITMPSTITRPASNPDPNKSNTIKFLLTAKVTDGNGADDVKRVFLNLMMLQEKFGELILKVIKFYSIFMMMEQVIQVLVTFNQVIIRIL